MRHSLLIPFLDKSPTYCYGVEFGMQVIAPMLRGKKCIKGYFRTENEEQIRLAAHRLGYTLVFLRCWKFNGQETGWVYMKLCKEHKQVGVTG